MIVVWAADMFVDGLLGVGRASRIAPFVLTVALSGLETENLAAGIAANAKGLPGRRGWHFSWRRHLPRALLGGEDGERVRRPGLRLLVGLGVLTGGGWLLGEGLRTTVRNLGISQSLLGNTAVAASVEAEEIARAAVPTRRGRPELGLGNIGATIVHFAAFNAGVIALVKPLRLGHDTTHFYLPSRR